MSIGNKLSSSLLLVSQQEICVWPTREGIDKRTWIYNNLFLEDSNLEKPRIDNWTYGTTEFKVFEVDLGGGKWKELKSLGNRALFFGHNSSISVEAFDFSRCRANCIYFTDSYLDTYWSILGGGGRDIGIYNMLDGSIEPHYQSESLSHITPPMWVMLSF